MEHVHGVDVSWMVHHGPTKDRTRGQRRNTVPAPSPILLSPKGSPTGSPGSVSPPIASSPVLGSSVPTTTISPNPKSIPSARPGLRRSPSSERNASTPPGTSPQRKGSWLSSLSSKFSSSPAPPTPPVNNPISSPTEADTAVPKVSPARNAVLQHASRPLGDGPYTPAPPKTTQGSLLHVFRRLSSSTGNSGPAIKGTHGLVERRVLNVDRHRERCPLADLTESKLRKVSFCVDVEIAPMPRYSDGGPITKKPSAEKNEKRKIVEKGEGETLKRPAEAERQKNDVDAGIAKDGPIPQKTEKQIAATTNGKAEVSSEKAGGDITKKKEKKKKSEEERKARKEKKRQLAEANGSIPLEIHLDSDSSAETVSTSKTSRRSQLTPTTNPVRIYRRCCQLRETPVLKKISEQLSDAANYSAEYGHVEKLDLKGYWLQLSDLITLGDYLSVVPIKEVILENCGLSDEGLRVILAGLLAAKKPGKRYRRAAGEPDGLTKQGGFVERLVVKNNQIGPEGWKHLCLFIYLCRTIKFLDLSSIAFPQAKAHAHSPHGFFHHSQEAGVSGGICQLLSKSIQERLAGSALQFIDLGDTGLHTDQLGNIIDGVIKCGIKRLGVAHNHLDADGVKHVARYIRSEPCEGLNLAGNDLRDTLDIVGDAFEAKQRFWALSLADSNLSPSSLNKLLPKLAKLDEFVFIDLSHNHDLFTTTPSSVSALRRYLPHLKGLKRIHLTDVGLSSEQAIALIEVFPEIEGLAHVNLLQNPEITRLADAATEADQEEACALFASLLAATRVSHSIVAVDIDVPTERSGEIVRAMAKQVVAYCLRNMEKLELSSAALAIGTDAITLPKPDADYPDVLQHLVGHDVTSPAEFDDTDPAPDEDYVVGGTGVAKALACVLKNVGDDFRRHSADAGHEVGSDGATPIPKVSPAKAKDMSKHLLLSARKIRCRLQPALERARNSPTQNDIAYRRLVSFDITLDGIIKRFEDEFPETRESADSAISISPPLDHPYIPRTTSPSAPDGDGEVETVVAAASDGEDETEIRPGMMRSNSTVSLSSKGLTNEEGRVFRAGHRFRSSWLDHYNLFGGIEEIGANPDHSRMLHELLDDTGDATLKHKAEEVGIVKTFQEDKDYIFKKLHVKDPEGWERFLESQQITKTNLDVASSRPATPMQERPTKTEKEEVEDVAVQD